MTSRVGPKGQVVIPKPLRDRLGIRPGDEVEFEWDGDAVRVGLAPSEALKGRFRGLGLVADLEGEHRSELDR